jgi:hypothetical protein
MPQHRLRLLNVRNPFSTALLYSKDIENRPGPFPFQPGLSSEWIGLVSSGNLPSMVDLKYLQTRLDQTTFLRILSRPPPQQALIGIIEIVGNTVDTTSVWYNGPPHVGWEIGRRARLPTPVPNVQGCQSLRYLDTYSHSRTTKNAMIRALNRLNILPPGILPQLHRLRIDEDDESGEPTSSSSSGIPGMVGTYDTRIRW